MKRGYSTEGDRMLDYIEHGVFDALEKGYVRSCVFAVFLVCIDCVWLPEYPMLMYMNTHVGQG